MMLIIYDVSLIRSLLHYWTCSWCILLYKVITTYVTSYMKKALLMSILSTWLCGVMGLHMTIALVCWEWDHFFVFCMLCLYDLLNMKCQHDCMIIFLWLWSCFMLIESLNCICSMVCALEIFKLLGMISKKWSFLMLSLNVISMNPYLLHVAY